MRIGREVPHLSSKQRMPCSVATIGKMIQSALRRRVVQHVRYLIAAAEACPDDGDSLYFPWRLTCCHDVLTAVVLGPAFLHCIVQQQSDLSAL